MNISDPYNEGIKLMRKHGSYNNPPSVEIGKVTGTNPLNVKIGDLPLTKDNLLVADYLLANYSRQINIPNTSATGSTTDGNISSISISNGTINFIDTLKENDLVALVKITNSATYIILCRVVKP
jgi:hypothetical protein